MRFWNFLRKGPLDLAAVEKKLSAGPRLAVVCPLPETSSGVLNDLAAPLRSLCAAHGVQNCAQDCISTVGTMPLDLNGVYLASGSSGKGLRAYPGLAMVFIITTQLPPPARFCRVTSTLALAAQQDGIPFTFSSNLLHALHAAIRRLDLEKAVRRNR